MTTAVQVVARSAVLKAQLGQLRREAADLQDLVGQFDAGVVTERRPVGRTMAPAPVRAPAAVPRRLMVVVAGASDGWDEF